MIVAVFEDEFYGNFLPITYTRPVFDCRTGMLSLFERFQRIYPESRVLLFTRDYLVPTMRKRVVIPVNSLDSMDDETLLVNGCLIMDEKIKQLIGRELTPNTLMMQKGRLAIALLRENKARTYSKEFCRPLTPYALKKLAKNCAVLEVADLPLLEYPWKLIGKNPELIQSDFAGLNEKESKGTIDQRTTVYGDSKNVYVGEDAFIEANVTLDVRGGPIFIGNETIVQSGSRITGPTYIAEKTLITSGLIREGCSIGPFCRIGGELDETIIQGYTNKYHTGFIGHAYIGEWINLGAGTNNSDLKNTYGTVKVTINGKKIDTGQTKVGCFIGDHVKASIGTQILTGKKIGVAAQIQSLITKDVPAFTIWPENLKTKPVELQLQSAVETQKRAFARRGVKQTDDDIELLKELFKITAPERKKTNVTKRKFVP